jgi:hypothetical protein
MFHNRTKQEGRTPWSSVADPACHFDGDPDTEPACHFDADPDSTFRFHTDPGPTFKKKAQNLEKVFK